MPDGLFEIWQANSHGRYNHPDDRRNLPLDAGFEGYGRASTFTDGTSRFATVKPGRVPWPGRAACRRRTSTSRSSPAACSIGWRRGSTSTAIRRSADDPVLKLVEPARRDTLIAKRDPTGAWRLPIHLGGPNETVFFDV